MTISADRVVAGRTDLWVSELKMNEGHSRVSVWLVLTE